MQLSQEILTLLDVLEKAQVKIIEAIGAVEEHMVEQGMDQDGDPDFIRVQKSLRGLAQATAETRLRPTPGLTDKALHAVKEFVDENDLDAHFTIQALAQVGDVVARWKRLKAIPVVTIPEERVTGYLRQASECYLYGLPTAAAILCRGVVQFSLEEKIPTLGGISWGEVDRRDWLMKLIKYAGTTKTLPPDLVAKAHRVREIGNESAHSGTCKEAKALTAIRETAEVLTHLYGTPT